MLDEVKIIHHEVKDKWYRKMVAKVKESPLNYPLWRVEDETDKLLRRVKDSKYPELSGEVDL